MSNFPMKSSIIGICISVPILIIGMWILYNIIPIWLFITLIIGMIGYIIYIFYPILSTAGTKEQKKILKDNRDNPTLPKGFEKQDE